MTTEECLTPVEIYTDGGCDPNPGPGGWGAVMVYGVRTGELSGAEMETTNNRMELVAAICALRALRRPCEVTLYTDSQYLRQGISEWLPDWQARGWRKSDGRPVENSDLWQALAAEVPRHRLIWLWVRGHHGNPLNERADQLATEARQRLLVGEAVEEGEAEMDPGSDSGSLPTVALYARGCALGARGPGGFAALLVHSSGQVRSICGGQPATTINAMELRAAIAGLQALPRPFRVAIRTSSKYVLEGATRWLAGWEHHGWRTRDGRAVKNREHWLELSRALGDHDVSWQHLGDRHDPLSQQAIALARAEAERIRNG